jgi:hypothetical protein
MSFPLRSSEIRDRNLPHLQNQPNPKKFKIARNLLPTPREITQSIAAMETFSRIEETGRGSISVAISFQIALFVLTPEAAINSIEGS